MILYIMRHGETYWNVAKRMQGKTDIALTEAGIEMAKISGENMKDLPIDLCISSPLMRATETARCVIGDRDIPILTDERVQEIGFGDWEGECVIEENCISPEYMDLFFSDPIKCERPPRGETFQDVQKRTGEFLEELIANPEYADKHILISSHGAAGRCLLSHFYEDKDDIWRGCVPPNCGVTIVEVVDGIKRVIEKDRVFY